MSRSRSEVEVVAAEKVEGGGGCVGLGAEVEAGVGVAAGGAEGASRRRNWRSSSNSRLTS